MMDSDGDGMLNGVELGDETCSWNKGDASPGPVKGHPGKYVFWSSFPQIIYISRHSILT